MKEYYLEGVKVQEIKITPDERGFFAEALRQDWKEFIGEEWIVQANIWTGTGARASYATEAFRNH